MLILKKHLEKYEYVENPDIEQQETNFPRNHNISDREENQSSNSLCVQEGGPSLPSLISPHDDHKKPSPSPPPIKPFIRAKRGSLSALPPRPSGPPSITPLCMPRQAQRGARRTMWPPKISILSNQYPEVNSVIIE